MFYSIQIRVFTYLIGREIINSEIVRKMACENKGYYTQIATIADVEENAVVSYCHEKLVLSFLLIVLHKCLQILKVLSFKPINPVQSYAN